jgi:hypothetical protein
MNRENFLALQKKLDTPGLRAARDFFMEHIDRDLEIPEIQIMHYHNNGLGSLFSMFRNIEDNISNLPESLEKINKSITHHFTRNGALGGYRERLADMFPEAGLRAEADTHLKTLEAFRDMLRDELQPALKVFLASTAEQACVGR